MFEYEAAVLQVIDGDTMKLRVDLGFHVHVETIVRLARINAPETVNFGVNGINDPARDYILSNVPIGSVCVCRITRLEKYGRWLADVYFQPGIADRHEILRNPRCLNDELVKNGLAKPYDGGKR